jgi:hypothetical protein
MSCMSLHARAVRISQTPRGLQHQHITILARPHPSLLAHLSQTLPQQRTKCTPRALLPLVELQSLRPLSRALLRPCPHLCRSWKDRSLTTQCSIRPATSKMRCRYHQRSGHLSLCRRLGSKYLQAHNRSGTCTLCRRHNQSQLSPAQSSLSPHGTR